MNSMRTRVSITLLASLGLLFLLPPAAQADVPTATLTFRGVVGTPPLYDRGVGINPYILDVQPAGGSATTMYLLCDDWLDHVWRGATWQADVIQGSDTTRLQGTRMAVLAKQDRHGADVDIVRLYNAKAYLELHMGSDNQSRIATSFALWYLFMPNTVSGANEAERKMAADAWDAVADDLHLHSLYRDRLTIYTPKEAYDKTHNLWNQEFNRVVPDGGVTLMLLGGALVGLWTLRRRFSA